MPSQEMREAFRERMRLNLLPEAPRHPPPSLRQLQSRIVRDRAFRIALCRRSFYWFFHVYFARYVSWETADFQREIFEELGSFRHSLVEVLAYRGSAKSTIGTTALPIWSIVGEPAKRFPLLIGDTGPQSKQYLHNVRIELEENEMLIADFGPFRPDRRDESADWHKTSIYIPKYKARISALSDGASVRGAREQERRPDLVVVDDIENVESVQKKERRDARYKWFKQDVMGLSSRASFVLIGNLLHSDSLMMRVKGEIERGTMAGRVMLYAIQDAEGNPTWPGRFPDGDALKAEKLRIGDEKTWQRESLMRIVAEDGQEVREEWIRRWDERMLDGAEVYSTDTGVDLAISKRDGADCTAMVSVRAVRLRTGENRIVVLPHPVNDRLSMHETITTATELSRALSPTPVFHVEDVGYQRAAIETMQEAGLAVQPQQVTADKRARLRTVAPLIQQGTVLFPETGCEDLLIQLIYMGTERHDDLVDALVYAVNAARESFGGGEVLWA